MVEAIKKFQPDAAPKVLENTVDISEKILKYKDKIKSDIEIKKASKHCFQHLCRNKSCVRSDPNKVRTDPNIEHSKTGTHESHIEDGIGGQVEVDCKDLEK